MISYVTLLTLYLQVVSVEVAMISLFDHDDEEMITSKYGNWWETNEQRGTC